MEILLHIYITGALLTMMIHIWAILYSFNHYQIGGYYGQYDRMHLPKQKM